MSKSSDVNRIIFTQTSQICATRINILLRLFSQFVLKLFFRSRKLRYASQAAPEHSEANCHAMNRGSHRDAIFNCETTYCNICWLDFGSLKWLQPCREPNA